MIDMREIMIAILGGVVGFYLASEKMAETKQALTTARKELSKLRDELVDASESK